MGSLYFEDFTVGSKYVTASRTITETDIILYCGLSGDFHPIHTDSEYAAQHFYGGRIAHGMLVATVIYGLWCRLGLMDEAGIASLETNWKYVGVVKPGDTVHAEFEVAKAIPRPKGGRGTVHMKVTALNQGGIVVLEGQTAFLIKTRQ